MHTQTSASQKKRSADPSLSAEEQLVRDALKTILHSRISRYHLENMLHYPPGSLGLQPVCLKASIGQMKKIEETLLTGIRERFPDGQFDLEFPFDPNPTAHLLFDLNHFTELMMRIGTREEDQYYQEFCRMMIECLNTVFFCKQRRSKIVFSKYKKLFKLIEEESVADAYGEGQNHFYVRDGQLSINLPAPVKKEGMA